MSPGFPRDRRITRGVELQRVLKEGKRIRTRFLDIRVSASPLCHSAGDARRVGIIVPKAKHSAVARNKLKRRLRELIRQVLLIDTESEDVVVLARRESYEATYEMLSLDMHDIATSLKALRSRGT